MRKVFLYLYPIEEYFRMFLFHSDEAYDEFGVKKPLPILNETITKRYREQGYEVMFALYPDKELFGIDLYDNDKIIYTDIRFKDASGYDSTGKEKNKKDIKYPCEYFLLEQVGKCNELRIGGFHYSDCVKRVAETAMNEGINVLVDLDLTDLFFNVYRKEEYFKMDKYDPKRYYEHITRIARFEGEPPRYILNMFKNNYGSPVYGMDFIQEEKTLFKVILTRGYKDNAFKQEEVEINNDKYLKVVYEELDKLIQEYCILKIRDNHNTITENEKKRLIEIMNTISYGYTPLLFEYYSWCSLLCDYCLNESSKLVEIGPMLRLE